MSAVRFTFVLVYLVLNFGTFASGIALAQTEYSEDSLIRKVQAPDPQSLRFSRNSGNETDFEENGSNQFVPADHSKSFPEVTYCAASGGCSEYISRVQFGTLDNLSGCTGYADYSNSLPSVYLPHTPTLVTVTNGAPYPGDQCGIWIDYNGDGDFDDANETLTVSGSPGAGPYTALINPVLGYIGIRKMRIRITWTGALSPCGNTTYGDVEDYKYIQISPYENVWLGTFDQNWHNPANWLLGMVPTQLDDVIIPSAESVARTPIINSNAECNSLQVYSGGLLHNAGTLSISGSLYDFYGYYTAGSSATLLFNGTNLAYWDMFQNSSYNTVVVQKPTGSTLRINTGGGIINKLDIRGGILELMSWAQLTVGSGIGSDALIIQSATFPASDGALKLNGYADITITGDLYCQKKSNIIMNGGTIFCSGNIIFINDAGYNINLSGGKFYFQGYLHEQKILQTNFATLTFGDVVVDKGYNWGVFLSNKNLTIAGNLQIISGRLSCGNDGWPTAWYNINIGGNWTNQNFPDGFIPGSGKVIFDGTGAQSITTSENFNTLEVNRTGAISINSAGTNVTCNSYNWISGGLEVLNGATFTALDLAQQGLFGSYRVNAGSTLNLYQDNTQWVDLDADVFFDGGGTINVYGGNGDSWWAFSRNASLTMNGGVLDFKDNGITVNNSSYSLNVMLTGYSVIRTTGGLNMNRTGFAPVGGTFELYGSLDRTISMGTTNSLPNVIINKSSKGEGDNLPVEPVFDARSGSMLTDGSRANQVSLTTNARITGDLTLLAGTLALNGRTLTADKNVTVYGTLKMTNTLDVLNAGTSQVHDLAFKNGSVASITQGNLNVYGWLTT